MNMFLCYGSRIIFCRGAENLKFCHANYVVICLKDTAGFVRPMDKFTRGTITVVFYPFFAIYCKYWPTREISVIAKFFSMLRPGKNSFESSTLLVFISFITFL